MEYFLVRYASRVVIYERKTFIRLATARNRPCKPLVKYVPKMQVFISVFIASVRADERPRVQHRQRRHAMAGQHRQARRRALARLHALASLWRCSMAKLLSTG